MADSLYYTYVVNTPSSEAFFVPNGFEANVEVHLWGAGGGSGSASAGGAGGYVKSTVTVAEGDFFEITVGGAGGAAGAGAGGAGGAGGSGAGLHSVSYAYGFGGGVGGTGTPYPGGDDQNGGAGGGGGGATVVIVNGVAVAVAGGGGGGGGGYSYQTGYPGFPGGAAGRFTATSSGGPGVSAYAASGGGGGGYLGGEAGGVNLTGPSGTGDDAGGGGAGYGGQSLGDLSIPGSDTTAGGRTTIYAPKSPPYGNAGYDGYAVLIFKRKYRILYKQAGDWKSVDKVWYKTPYAGTFSNVLTKTFNTVGTASAYAGAYSVYGGLNTSAARSHWNYLHNGTTDWTVELWFNTNDLVAKNGTGGAFLFTAGNPGTPGIDITLNDSAGNPVDATAAVQVYMFGDNSTQYRLYSGPANAYAAGVWTHLAVVFDSATKNIQMYFNGSPVLVNVQDTGGWNNSSFSSNPPVWDALFCAINGYTSNMRITKAKVYTSAFTVPTSPLTAIANTDLLIAQDSTLKDNSTNAFTITTAGSPGADVVKTLNPFPYYHGGAVVDGTNNFTIPDGVHKLTVNYPTPDGIATKLFPVTPGETVAINLGDFGVDSTIKGTAGTLTLPAYNTKIFAYSGNVDHIIAQDVSVATDTGAPLTVSGSNATITAAATAAGITYNVTYEGWHGDLGATIYFTPVKKSTIFQPVQVYVANGSGRQYPSAHTYQQQPSAANNYVMNDYQGDYYGGEGGYYWETWLQQQGYVTITYDQAYAPGTWLPVSNVYYKDGDWKPLMNNVDLKALVARTLIYKGLTTETFTVPAGTTKVYARLIGGGGGGGGSYSTAAVKGLPGQIVQGAITVTPGDVLTVSVGGGGGGGEDYVPPAASGGGGGCKIICTKLHELGYLPDNIYAADELFGRWLRTNDPYAYYGYVKWASVVVDWMESDGPQCMFWIKDKDKRGQAQRELAIKWARRIATPWAEHMAYKMGVGETDNRAGRMIMTTGMWISRLIGKYTKTTEPSKSVALGYVMWATFGVFWLLAGIK